MQDNNFRRAQSAYERSGEAEYERRIEASEAKERWIEDNGIRGIVEFMDDFKGNEGAELAAILQETEPTNKHAVEVCRYIKAHFDHDGLNTPEYATLGKALCDWFNDGVWPIVESELEKEYDKLS